MNRSQILNVVLWTLAALCVALGLATSILYGRLQGRVVELQTQVARLEDEAATLQSNKAITRTAFGDLQDLLKQPVETPEKVCANLGEIRLTLRSLSSAQREGLGMAGVKLLNLAESTCSVRQGGLMSPDYRATRQFVDAYIDAVGARVSGDYDAADRDYTRALAVEDNGTINPQWRMRALEGLADAKLHRKDYSGAQARLDELQALRLSYNRSRKVDYRFVFQDITQIKLMCATKKPASQIAQSLARLRADFDAYAASQPTAKLKAYAVEDRRTIELDAELHRLCGTTPEA